MARVSNTECRKMYQERKGYDEGHIHTVHEKRCPIGKMLNKSQTSQRNSNST